MIRPSEFSSSQKGRYWWAGYAVAVGGSALVVAVRALLDQYELLDQTRLILLTVPIVLAAFVGGWWPGLLATALTAVAAELLFFERGGRFAAETVAALGLFIVEGLFFSWIGEARLRAQRDLLQSNAELEQRVAQRTVELQDSNESLSDEISERRRFADELQEANNRLEVSNRELQDFASVASHDLQEPLRKIQAFGERLHTRSYEQLGPDGRDYLDRMLKAASRMQRLINDLLTFSRVTTRAQPFGPVDLKDVAREVLIDLESRVEQSGAMVELGELPVVEADAMQMRQLFQNLIANGLKFARPGVRPELRIYSANGVEAGDGRPAVQVFVQDNGIGFDEKYLDRIFNVFQRLHARNEFEGTGIGLAVCRKIADRHGGSITARSRPGEGATFITTLPLEQPAGDEGDGSRDQTDHHSAGR